MANVINPSGDIYDEFGRRMRSNMVGDVPINLSLPQNIPMIPPNVPAQVTHAPTRVNPDDFAPLPITPHPASPLQAEREALKPPDINDPAFKQGRLRTVLNAIAGGLAGAANPRLGVEVGSYLHDLPYNRARVQYETKSKDLDTKITQENKRFEQAAEEAKLGSAKGTAINLAGNRAGTLADRERRTDIAQEESTRKAARDAIYKKYTDWKMANPKMSDFQFMAGLSDDELKDAKEVWNEMHKGTRKSLEQIEQESAAREKGKLSVSGSPAAIAAKEAGAAATAKGSTTGKIDASTHLNITEQARIDGAVQRTINDPDSASEIAKEFKDTRVQTAYYKQLADAMQQQGDNIANLPHALTTPQKNTHRAALTALKHIDTIEGLMKQADEMGILGPMRGRFANLKQYIGGGFDVGDSGKSVYAPGTNERVLEDKLVGEIVALQSYLSTFEASSASGTRPSWQLIKVMEKVSPNVRMNRDMFEGALSAGRSSVTNRIASLFQRTKEGMPITGAPGTEKKPRFTLTPVEDK